MKKLFLLFAFVFILSCAKKEEDIIDNNDAKTAVNSTEVSAEDGGIGFDKIAESLGYMTFKCTKFRDPNAKKGGTLRDSISEYPSTFRNIGPNAYDSNLDSVKKYLYDSLLKYSNYDSEYCPSLASHWQWIKGDNGDLFKGLKLRIDPNARWSDGKPVTADDVIATWKLRKDKGIMDPDTNNDANKIEITKISPYLINIDIVDPDSRKNWIDAIYIPQFEILPAHYISTVDGADYLKRYDKELLPGTGPYEVLPENVKQDNSILKTRKKDWWAKDYPRNKNLYNYDAISYDVIVEENINKEKFKKGELDVYTPVSREWYDDFGKESKFDFLKRNLISRLVAFYEWPHKRYRLHFNLREKPFDDVRVRKAIGYLWDRNKVNAFNSNDTVTIDSQYPLSKFQSPDIENYLFDPEKGNALLDEAGYNLRDKDGIRMNADGERLEFNFYIWSSTFWKGIFVLFQEDLKEAGIKINLIVLSFSEVIDKLDNRDFKMLFMPWDIMQYPLPWYNLYSKLADKKNTNNNEGIKNSIIDDLIDKYNKETVPLKRKLDLQAIDLEVNKNVYGLNVCQWPFSNRILKWRYLKVLPESAYGYNGETSAWWIDTEELAKVKKAMTDKSITFEQEQVLYDKWNLNITNFEGKY